MSTVPTCRIDVLAEYVGISYTYAELEQKVAAISQELLLSIGDIEIAAAAADPSPAARFQFVLTAQASATHGPALTNRSVVENHPFRVSCDGQALFVGVIYLREGAAALITPVLHVEAAADDTITLLLGAEEGAWTSWGGPGSQTERERIDRSELRAALCARGILDELEPAP